MKRHFFRTRILIFFVCLNASLALTGCKDKNTSDQEKTSASMANPAKPTDTAGIQLITPEQLDTIKNESDVTLLDVREPFEFTGRNGSVSGSINIPLNQLDRRLSELDKNRRIVVICLSGQRAQTAASRLAASGFQKLFILDGGMLAYNRRK